MGDSFEAVPFVLLEDEMKKTFDVEGRQMTAACNGLLPKLYRFNFGRDIMMDLKKFHDGAKKDPESVDMTPLENLTWLMFKEGGEDVGETPDEWLRTLEDPASVYILSQDMLALWQQSQRTTATPKKK